MSAHLCSLMFSRHGGDSRVMLSSMDNYSWKALAGSSFNRLKVIIEMQSIEGRGFTCQFFLDQYNGWKLAAATDNSTQSSPFLFVQTIVGRLSPSLINGKSGRQTGPAVVFPFKAGLNQQDNIYLTIKQRHFLLSRAWSLVTTSSFYYLLLPTFLLLYWKEKDRQSKGNVGRRDRVPA